MKNIIIGFLGAFAVAGLAFLYWLKKEEAKKVMQEQQFVISGVKAPIIAYRLQLGHYPTTAEGLEALLTAPPGDSGRWAGPYLDREPLDAWGRPYGYRSPGIHSSVGYDIWSEGPDPTTTEDDIRNW